MSGRIRDNLGVLLILAVMIAAGSVGVIKKGLLFGLLISGGIGVVLFAVFLLIDATFFAAWATKKE